MSQLRFDGRVAIVTGAGNGLGKAYALLLGERGAKVVVNDLGGDIKGGGKSSRPADIVVEEIKRKGGQAVANYDSVEFGEKLVQTALDNFGRIDIIINNAGILRDRSFARISDDDWDIIQQVHLRGPFKTIRAAWPHMKKQKYGRVIMVTSTSGIYGNFGQANYSAAKLGAVGLANTLAVEGQKYNILVNSIAPTAGSRMTETVMPKDMVDALKPGYVAPLVAYLCHESNDVSSGVFEVGAGWMSRVRLQKSKGAVVKRKNEDMTLEHVRDKMAQIQDYTEHTFPRTSAEAGSDVNAALDMWDEGPSNSAPSTQSSNASGGIQPERAIGFKGKPDTMSYTERDVILYALGVGVSTKQEDHLKFTFELSDDFSVLPTFGVIPAFSANSISGAPGLDIDPTMILHGEQYLELFQPLQPSDTLTTQAEIVDVLDKGRGAIIISDMVTRNQKGEKVAFNQFSTYVQRAGGFGGKRSSPHAKAAVDPPQRAPDASIQEQTGVDQAAIYRLSGDRNPLHIDPSFAAMGGFSTPILHGLASFGYAGRHVLKQYCNNDVSKFKAIKVRFTKPVLPGQTIQTDMWKEGSRVHFQCKVVETGAQCLSGCYVDLHEGSGSAGQSASASSGGLQAAAIFDMMKSKVSSDPSVAKKANCVFQFNITKDNQKAATWTADLKSAQPSVYQGEPQGKKADCTFTLSDENFVAMASGKLNGQQAFMQGKLKLSGNMMLAQKLGALFQDQAKL